MGIGLGRVLVGLGRVCEFLNLTANNAGCRNLHTTLLLKRIMTGVQKERGRGPPTQGCVII